MSHSILPLPPDWPGDVVAALMREAAGLPAPEPGQIACDPPREECAGERRRFAGKLHAARIRTRQGAYTAIWLEAGVEAEVDEAWKIRPEKGFWLHAMAGSLCLAAVRELAPEAAAFGCAPVPGPDPELAGALRRAGLDCTERPDGRASPLPGRRYAVITPHPFAGGCGACALAPHCPRRGGSREFGATEFNAAQ